MKNVRKIEIIIILILIISICMIYFDRFFKLEILYQYKVPKTVQEDLNSTEINVSFFNTDTIPSNAFIIKNSEHYIREVENLLSKWNKSKTLSRLGDIPEQHFINDKIKKWSKLDYKGNRKLIDIESKRLISENNIRNIADLPLVGFNQFFEVLDHIQLQNNYVLDYIYYYDRLSGIPLIYARKHDDLPYNNLSSFPSWEKYLINFHLQESLDRHFIKYIEVDKSALSYFQLAVLALYCDHFFLYWHSNYRDESILSNNQEIEKSIDFSTSEIEAISDSTVKDKYIRFKNEISQINITPYVVMQNDIVQIVFHYFTYWGGLYIYRVDWKVSKIFPHQEVSLSKQKIVNFEPDLIY